MDAAKNFAKVTVDGPYEDSATEIDVIFTASNPLPTPPFNAVWWNATDYPDPADDPGVEIVRVTAQVDTALTITRAQEGTAASDHNLAGKTYKMIAGMTARTVNEDLLGDVHGSGPAVLVVPSTPDITLRVVSATKFITLGGSYIQLQHSQVYIGDFEGQGNSAHVSLDDANSKITLTNVDLATTQSQSASGPVGTVVGKLPIYDGSGTLLGYLPIYGSIT